MANLKKIKMLCYDRNITMDELAKSVGITHQGLGKIIRDSSTRVDTLEKIAKCLKVPISYFFDESIETIVAGENQYLKEIESLKKDIEQKDRIIKLQEKVIESLEREKKNDIKPETIKQTIKH